ncbi:hypothetical protein GCM10027049_09840 [Mucilaginibacter puniceus]
MATPHGLLPTGIVVINALVVAFITDTVLLLVRGTYNNGGCDEGPTGVAVMVALIGLPVIFVAVNAAISPVPLAARPIAGLLLVQVYVHVVTGKLTTAV